MPVHPGAKGSSTSSIEASEGAERVGQDELSGSSLTDARQILKVARKLFRNYAVVHVQSFLTRCDQSQFGEHFEMVRQCRRGDGVFGMHLAAEELIVLGDLRVDGEPVRISECPADLSYLVVGHFSHIYSDAIGATSGP